MVAPTSAEPRIGTFTEPSCPLTPELRSDLAYRRAQGRSWEDLGEALHCDPDALRRATENDPEFAAVQKRARKEAWHQGQADGLRRLRVQANGSDEEKALKASKVLVEYAAEQHENETRLKIERLRAKTRLAVEELRSAARASARDADDVFAPLPRVDPDPLPKTEAEWAARRERIAQEGSVKENAEVYIWGGKHPLGRSHGPDESDVRVRVKADWSCGSSSRGTVYWVVPDPVPPKAVMPGDPDAPAIIAAAWGTI